MIPGLLLQGLLGALLGDDDVGLRRRRASGDSLGALFGSEEKRFKKWAARNGVALPPAGMVDYSSKNGGNDLVGPAGASPATIDFPERGTRKKEEPKVVPPPLPTEEAEASPPPPAGTDWFVEVPDREVADTLAGRALFAMIAAAHADGTVSDRERSMIAARMATLPPAEAAFLRDELAAPRPMGDYADPAAPMAEKRLIFGLAVATLKADGKVAPEENRFAGKLARALGLSKEEATAIVRSL
jgi:hypothetical protein